MVHEDACLNVVLLFVLHCKAGTAEAVEIKYCLPESFCFVKVECCGADSPQDWIEYNSTYRMMFGTAYPWPKQCCKTLTNSEVEDPEGCQSGLTTTVFTKVGYAN